MQTHRDGVIEICDGSIDFEKTYTFEETGPDCAVVKWPGVRPERGAEGQAIFRLKPSPVEIEGIL